MSRKKNGLIFYISHYEAIKDSLSDEQLGRLFRLIFEKQLGNEVVLDKDIEIAFNFINNQLLVDAEKYEEISRKRSDSGKKGGAPKGNKNASKTTQTSKTNKNKQNKLKDNDNNNDNDKDNDNDNVNDNVNNKDNYLNNSCSCFERIEKEFGRPLAPSEFEKIVLWQNEYADELILYAVEIAVANNKKTIQYVNGILRNWKTLGYRSKQDVLDAEIKREEKRAEELFDYDWLNEEDL